MMHPSEGRSTTLSLTDDGRWWGGDTPNMRVFIPKNRSMLYKPVYPLCGKLGRG